MQVIVSALTRNIHAVHIYKHMSKAFKDAFYQNKVKLQTSFFLLMVKKRWIKKVWLNGSNLTIIFQKRIKMVFSAACANFIYEPM